MRLKAEKERSEALLRNILPDPVVCVSMRARPSLPIALRTSRSFSLTSLNSRPPLR